MSEVELAVNALLDVLLLSGSALQTAVWWGWTGRRTLRFTRRPRVAVLVMSTLYFAITVCAFLAFPSFGPSAHDFPAGLALIVTANVVLNIFWLSFPRRSGSPPIA